MLLAGQSLLMPCAANDRKRPNSADRLPICCSPHVRQMFDHNQILLMLCVENNNPASYRAVNIACQYRYRAIFHNTFALPARRLRQLSIKQGQADSSLPRAVYNWPVNC